MIQRSLFVTLCLLASVAMAAEHGGEAHGLNEHTIHTIIFQAINVSLLFAGLVYFLRKPVKDFFKTKQQDFVATSQKALELKRVAELERADIQVKLSKLESTNDESLSRARAEAADMKKNMIAEAQALSKRIHEEAEVAAKLEVEKAKNRLRQQMIREAATIAGQQMKDKISGDDQKRLQSEFIDHIQAVTP